MFKKYRKLLIALSIVAAVVSYNNKEKIVEFIDGFKDRFSVAGKCSCDNCDPCTCIDNCCKLALAVHRLTAFLLGLI
jgi:hypothetical protein